MKRKVMGIVLATVLTLSLALVLTMPASAAVMGTEDGETCGPTIPAGRVYLIDNTEAKIDANPVIVDDPNGLDLRLHCYENDTEIRVFNEQQNVYVTGLAYEGGSYTGYVASHMIHQEPELGEPGVPTPTPYQDAMRGRGCIMFATPIIGIIISDADLDASDGVVGLTTVTYPTGLSLRGLEMGPERNYQDLIEVDGNTVKIDLQSVEVMDQIRVLTEPVVDIDIKPGSYPNSINPSEHGLLPVAILGSASFDVNNVNPETITLGGQELASRGSVKAPKLAYSFEDVNLDGYTDMVCFFSVQELALTGTEEELTLEAELFDGTPIQGTDSVRIVPP